MIEVELPNGTIVEFPENTSNEEMEKAIHNAFPEYSPREKVSGNSKSESIPEKALRYLIKDPLIGASEIGRNIINAPHNIINSFNKNLAKKTPTYPEINYESALGIDNKPDVIDEISRMSPELMTSILLPEAKIPSIINRMSKFGPYLRSALGNALSQGVFAGIMNPDKMLQATATSAGIAAPFSALSSAALSGNPKLRAAARLGLAGGGGLLGYGAAKELTGNETASDLSAALGALLGYKGISSKNKVAGDMLKGVSESEYLPALEASNRLGLTYLTPAEATGNPFVGASQGNVGRTAEGSKLLYNKSQERLQSEENAIKVLLDTIYNPKEHEAIKQSLYKSAGSKLLPIGSGSKNPIPEKFKDNEIIKQAVKNVERKPAFREKLKEVPKNSIEYLNQVKIALDDMIEGAAGGERNILKETKKKFVEEMDKIAPEYKEGRALAEREITRRKLEESFNKKPMTGLNLYKTLENKGEYKKLLNSLRNIPYAQEKVRDMKLVFKNLINPPTARTAAALNRTSMTKNRSSAQSFSDLMKEALSGGGYDKASVELITNPNWKNELNRLNEVTGSEKLSSTLFNLLARPGSQIVSSMLNK